MINNKTVHPEPSSCRTALLSVSKQIQNAARSPSAIPQGTQCRATNDAPGVHQVLKLSQNVQPLLLCQDWNSTYLLTSHLLCTLGCLLLMQNACLPLCFCFALLQHSCPGSFCCQLLPETCLSGKVTAWGCIFARSWHMAMCTCSTAWDTTTTAAQARWYCLVNTQCTRPRTVCIEHGDASLMVKRPEHKQSGCTGAACLYAECRPSACLAGRGSCSSAAYRGAAASLWPAFHAPSAPDHAWHPCWPGALAEGQISSDWSGLCLSLPSSKGKTSRHAWKQLLLLDASVGPSQQPEMPGTNHMQTVWCMLPCESSMLGQNLILQVSMQSMSAQTLGV